MIVAVESYLSGAACRRFTPSKTVYLLRSFTGFVANQKWTLIRTATGKFTDLAEIGRA
jgi:hypothetical protein